MEKDVPNLQDILSLINSLDATLGLLRLAPFEAVTAFAAFTGSNYPFLNPNKSPGMNPKAAATGKPVAASTVVECVAN